MQKLRFATAVITPFQRIGLLRTAPAGVFGSTSGFIYPGSREAAYSEVRTELVRKSIHLLIALVPSVALVTGVDFMLALLGIGTLFYAYAETLRLNGHPVAVISYITTVAARDRDRGRFVLGPVTLGLGAMLALLLYPLPAASIAIYSLAFGDGLASLVGKMFGRLRIPFTRGKTFVGSATCFVAVYEVTLAVLGSPKEAAIIAAGATLLEMIPVRDLDNLLLPMGVGLLANFLIAG
ncbi:MAG TPA: phosphatidate cytidylyltransferase [Spirochaetia bacterium]|nr:phosphatidate cytidylyltransferase [Spirochaetia bacterium]